MVVLTSSKILCKPPFSLLCSSFLPFPKHSSSFSPNFSSFPHSPLQNSTVRASRLSQTPLCYSILRKEEVGFSGFCFKPMGKAYSRLFAVSGDSSGGSGGGNGGGGFGGSGGNHGGSGGGSNDGNQSKWSFLAWYMDLLMKFPVLTKSVTSALLNLIGDVICQLVIDKVPSLDYKRTFMFTFMGLALVGPTLHYWYLYLSKLVTIPGASGAFLRLLLDQFLFAPIFIGTSLSVLMTLEGRPSQIVPKLQQEWKSTVLANWKLWIPFQFLNFRFVPQQFQVLASNFVAVIWNVILSFKAHTQVVLK